MSVRSFLTSFSEVSQLSLVPKEFGALVLYFSHVPAIFQAAHRGKDFKERISRAALLVGFDVDVECCPAAKLPAINMPRESETVWHVLVQVSHREELARLIRFGAFKERSSYRNHFSVPRPPNRIAFFCLNTRHPPHCQILHRLAVRPLAVDVERDEVGFLIEPGQCVAPRFAQHPCPARRLLAFSDGVGELLQAAVDVEPDSAVFFVAWRPGPSGNETDDSESAVFAFFLASQVKN